MRLSRAPRIEHVFARAGTYTVMLTVTDSGGADGYRDEDGHVVP